jgi:hypothetical protein
VHNRFIKRIKETLTDILEMAKNFLPDREFESGICGTSALTMQPTDGGLFK